MILRANEVYRIKYQEDTDCKTGEKLVMNATPHNPDYLEFTGSELYEVIMVMGLLPNERNNPAVSLSRSNEISFKLHMVQLALKKTTDNLGNNYLSLDDDAMKFLDSSEKAAISYWLGMFFATLVAIKEYNFWSVVHFARFEQSSYCRHKIPKNKRRNPKTKKIIKMSSPDLVAIDNTLSKYGVFEAKGYQIFRRRTMVNAIDQVQQIKSINSDPDIKRIVAYSRLNSSAITLRTKDPTKGKIKLELDTEDALLWQYMPLYDLTKELGIAKDNRYAYCEIDFVEGFEVLKFHPEFYGLLQEASDDYKNEKSMKKYKGRIADLVQKDYWGVKVE